MIAQYTVYLPVTGINTGNADVNNDGTINVVDALIIAQYSVGVIAQLNCPV